MSRIGPPGSGPVGALLACGQDVARGLLEPLPVVVDGLAGWRGALQSAADLSHQDQEILRIADEIHMSARDITTPAAVVAYAASTWPTITGRPALAVLQGMLEAVEDLGRSHP